MLAAIWENFLKVVGKHEGIGDDRAQMVRKAIEKALNSVSRSTICLLTIICM